MFVLIRMAYICFFTCCYGAAFANTHQIHASGSLLAPSHRSGDLYRSQVVSYDLDILPHPALPSGEPFNLTPTSIPTGEMSAKWSALQSRISADENALAACRSGESTCSRAERRFLSIVELGREHEGRTRLGWLNRAVNMSIKPVSDWVQYGDADYWASPLQTLGSGTGDCEDYAIVKYAALRAVGVQVDDLRIVIVEDDRRRTEHAVTAVHFEQQWLILDNLTMAIITAEDARNYRSLFVLNSPHAVAFTANHPTRAHEVIE